MTAKDYKETVDRAHLAWRRSTQGDGEFVEVADLPDGGWAVRDSKDPDGPVLYFTPAEREAFVEGVKDGEFDQ